MEKTNKELIKIISQMDIILDYLPFHVWYKDINGKYLFVNDSFAKYTNKSKEEIIGKDDYELYPKEEAEIYRKSDSHTILSKRQAYYESEYPKGKYKEEYKSPVYDKDGKIIATTGYAINITERRKTNEALVESERSKAILLSNLPGVAYRCKNDKDWTMTFISQGCYELTGYTAKELLEKNPSYYDLIDSQYRNALFKKWETELNMNVLSTDEYPITTSSGEIKWVWEQAQGIHDSDGKLISTEGFITDITERKIAEKALIQSEERFRTIFEEAPLGIGIFDSIDGKAYEINNRFAEIVGRKKEEILNLNWKDYSHPDDLEENLHNMHLLNMHESSGFSMNKRFIRPDGSIIWVNMTIAPFKLEDYINPRHLCMIKDITSQKKAEEEILYLSYYDQLTGLYNRRFYEEEIKRLDTKRNLPITLVLADVNGLKLINDAFGHLVGDKLLKKIAQIIKSGCRSDDIIARIGGDEFILLLPKTDSIEAEKIVKRINLAISKEKVEQIFCSVSFGWETKKDVTQDIRQAYRQAEDYMYRHKLCESTSMRNETIKVIMNTFYQKNKKEQQHCERVSKICESFGNALSMSISEVKELKMAGLFHDIGKIGMNDKLLGKKHLNEKEEADIKRHSEIGYHILRSVNEFAPIAKYVLYHHERIDGKGYPRELKGNEIPIQSKIISIIDYYDILTNENNNNYSKLKIIEELRKNANTKFDSELVELFIEKMLKNN
ncbi:sensor domain-containing diguanylate cyclase/phosphohydrolase [Anaerovorax odorimutans]|uniref:sensor domain-containing diguanylate cyclase/phosphohydrolase n=1 Tax=Anaerovorax odorimutans TaxID=109327 RepID=UPI0004199CF3|nr:PAS domain S-box protein [Anaerovorax odorimutans]